MNPQVPVVGETLVADDTGQQVSGMSTHMLFQAVAVGVALPAVVTDVA